MPNTTEPRPPVRCRPGLAALIMAAVMLADGPAFAAAPAPSSQDWAQEPATLFEIALGKALPSPADLPDCPSFAPFRREPQYEGPCVDAHQGLSQDRVALRNAPLGNVTSTATVVLHEGVVQAIFVPFEHARHDAMKALLIERYGAAHERTTDAGAERLTWTGRRVTITLRERGATDGEGNVEFSVNAAGR
jgi:hypothetical protein